MAAELEARLRAMAIGDVEAAISGGDVEAVRRWIELGGDVNAKGDGTRDGARGPTLHRVRAEIPCVGPYVPYVGSV